jgi:hypothetical protein
LAREADVGRLGANEVLVVPLDVESTSQAASHTPSRAFRAVIMAGAAAIPRGVLRTSSREPRELDGSEGRLEPQSVPGCQSHPQGRQIWRPEAMGSPAEMLRRCTKPAINTGAGTFPQRPNLASGFAIALAGLDKLWLSLGKLSRRMNRIHVTLAMKLLCVPLDGWESGVFSVSSITDATSSHRAADRRRTLAARRGAWIWRG